MRYFSKMTKTTSHRWHRKLLQIISVTLCVSMLMIMGGCLQNNAVQNVDGTDKSGQVSSTSGADTDSTDSADSNYYVSQELGFFETKEGESLSVLSVILCKDQVAVLISVMNTDMDLTPDADQNTAVEYSSEYFLLLYSHSGKLTQQIDMSEYFSATMDSIGCMSGNADGSMDLLVYYREADSADEEEANHSTIYSLDASGTQYGDPIPLSLSDGFYPMSMISDQEGNRYVGGYGSLAVFDGTGAALYSLDQEALTGELLLIGNTIYAVSDVFSEEESACLLYPLDSSAQDFGTPVDLSEYFPNGYRAVYAGGDGICFSTADGIDTLNVKTKEKRSLLYWKNQDAMRTTSGDNKVVILSDDKILMLNVIYTENSSSEVSLILLARTDENPNAEKQIITLGGMGISSDDLIQKAVYEFNRSHSESQIEIRDYYADAVTNEQEEYMTLVNLMNLEILAGDGPDIIYGSADLLSIYAAKGCLADLYLLMDEDRDFSRDDYLQSVLRLCETDGKLYRICPYFMIEGLVGAVSLVGERKGWKMDEFSMLTNSLPAGMQVLDKNSQLQWVFLFSLLAASHDSLINYSSNEVHFDSEAFCQLLACAKANGMTEAETVSGGALVMGASDMLIKNGELALEQCIITHAYEYNRYIDIFGEPVSVTGYPSTEGGSALCTAYNFLGVSSVCDDTTAAWEFVESIMAADIPQTVIGIPVLRSAFESQIEAAMNIEKGTLIHGYEATPMSKASAEAYRELVDGLDTPFISDTEIYAIVKEESASYFADQKSAEDVAALIQNRAQVLMDERG